MRLLSLIMLSIAGVQIFLGLRLSTLAQSLALTGGAGLIELDVPSARTRSGTGTVIGRLNYSQQGGVGKVRFRPFATDPMYHNKTVNGETIPGLFLNDRLFLIGARLTR
jgi:hypothetical protein